MKSFGNGLASLNYYSYQMSTQANPQPPKHQQSPELGPNEYNREFILGKVRIPKTVSRTIDGFMTALLLKDVWDMTPVVRILEDEYED